MTRLILLIILSSCCKAATGQKITLKNFNRECFFGVPNPFQFLIDKKYDSVDFRVHHGTIEKYEKRGYFLLHPDSVGADSIFSTVFYKHRIILKDTFPIQSVRTAVFPTVLGKIRGSINLISFKQSQGIIFKIAINGEHWENCTIGPYKFTVIRNGVVLFSMEEPENRFSARLISAIAQIKAGDLVLISDGIPKDQLAALGKFIPAVFEIN